MLYACGWVKGGGYSYLLYSEHIQHSRVYSRMDLNNSFMMYDIMSSMLQSVCLKLYLCFNAINSSVYISYLSDRKIVLLG